MKKQDIINAIVALGFTACIVNETATVQELKALLDQLSLSATPTGFSEEQLNKAVLDAKSESAELIVEKDEQIRTLNQAVSELNATLAKQESAPSRKDRIVDVDGKKYQIVSGVNLLVDEERVTYSPDDLLNEKNAAILTKLVEQGSGALKELED